MTMGFAIPSDEMETFEIRHLPLSFKWDVDAIEYAVLTPYVIRPEDEFGQWFQSFKQFADDNRTKRLMIDGRSLEKPPERMVKYRAMEIFSRLMPPPYRMAILEPLQWLDHFTEDVAINRGAKVIIGHDPRVLLSWLWGREPDVKWCA